MKAYWISQLVLLIFSGMTGNLLAQAPENVPVGVIVDNAASRSKAYVETFKNLISEEKKTVEIFDKNGEIKKRRIIDSTFLVYPLSKAEGEVAEFRNVTSVDGKKIHRSSERAEQFFERVNASEISQGELDRIRDESTRFDEDFAISGLTMFQAIALSEQLRPAFRFSLAGREMVAGNEVYVIQFDQIKADNSVTINSTFTPAGRASHNYDIEIDGGNVELNARIRGKLWVDVQTFNIRRELRERTIQPKNFTMPLVVAEDILQYNDSGFGILSPQKLTHLQYRVTLRSGEARKDTRVVFEYGRFTRPDVEIRSADVKDGN